MDEQEYRDFAQAIQNEDARAKVILILKENGLLPERFQEPTCKP